MAKKNDDKTKIVVIAKMRIFLSDSETYVEKGADFLIEPEKAQLLLEKGLIEYKAEPIQPIEFKEN